MRGTLGSTVPEWVDSGMPKPIHLATSVTFNKFRLVTPHKLGKNPRDIDKSRQTFVQYLS